MKTKAVTIGVSALLTLLLLSGCSSSNEVVTSEPAVAPDMNSGFAYEDSSAGSSVTKDGNLATSQVEENPEDSKVVVDGSLALISENPTDAVTAIRDEIVKVRGKIQSLEEVPQNEYRNAYSSLTVRIPSEQYESTVEAFKKLGTVENYTVQTTEVSDQLADYEVREKVVRGSIDRLIVLLNTATDTNTLVTIESTLSQREIELEQILAAKSSLEDKVTYSTLYITVTQTDDAAKPAPLGFWDGLVNGWNAFVATVVAITIGVGFLLPWLVVLGVVSILGWFFLKRRRTKKLTSNHVAPEKEPTSKPEPASTIDDATSR